MNAQHPDPSLRQVRDEIIQHVNLDGRVRKVEIQQATTEAVLSSLKEELRQTKTDIVAEIRASKPPSPWPAVGALAAVLSVVLLIAARLYGS
jgi:hypothetical protein